MGRPVRIRKDGYASDVTALARLTLALKSDKRISQARLHKLVKLLDAAVGELISVDRALGLLLDPRRADQQHPVGAADSGRKP